MLDELKNLLAELTDELQAISNKSIDEEVDRRMLEYREKLIAEIQAEKKTELDEKALEIKAVNNLIDRYEPKETETEVTL